MPQSVPTRSVSGITNHHDDAISAVMATLERIVVAPTAVTVSMQSLANDGQQTITSRSPDVVRFVTQMLDARANYAYFYIPVDPNPKGSRR
jgi:hypothetical protein